MQDDITPEEKLLKLIKEGAAPAPREETIQASGAPPTSVRPKPQPSVRSSHLAGLRALSLASRALVLVLACVLGLQYLLGEPVLPLPVPKGSGTGELMLPETQVKIQENFDAYAKIFQAKNIFKSMGEPPPHQAGPVQRATVLSDLVKNLAVSGIIAGEKPQAVIEDRTNGQFYYVEAGDYIGPLQVVEVGEGHVLLRYGDEEGELTL